MLAEINESAVGIDMTSPCQYPVPVGIEKGYIPDENIWTTSQINNLRGARFARLRGWKGLYLPLIVQIFSAAQILWHFLDIRHLQSLPKKQHTQNPVIVRKSAV